MKKIILAIAFALTSLIPHISYPVLSPISELKKLDPSLPEWKKAFASLPRQTQQKVHGLIKSMIQFLKAAQKAKAHPQKINGVYPWTQEYTQLLNEFNQLAFEITDLYTKAATQPNTAKRTTLESQIYLLNLVSNKISIIFNTSAKNLTLANLSKRIPPALKKLNACLLAAQKTLKSHKR